MCIQCIGYIGAQVYKFSSDIGFFRLWHHENYKMMSLYATLDIIIKNRTSVGESAVFFQIK